MMKLKLYQALLPLAAATLMAACGGGNAKSVVSQADGALSQIKEEAATSAPHELQTAEGTLAQMKQNLDAREYDAVVADVPKFNEQFIALKTAMEENQGKVVAAVQEWQALNAEVPKTVDEIQKRVDSLNTGKLPKDVTKEEFETAKADLETIKSQWAEATEAAMASNPIVATEKARLVQAKAEEIKSSLGMTPQVAKAG
jgi:chromosome segregation ATPase